MSLRTILNETVDRNTSLQRLFVHSLLFEDNVGSWRRDNFSTIFWYLSSAPPGCSPQLFLIPEWMLPFILQRTDLLQAVIFISRINDQQLPDQSTGAEISPLNK